MALPSKPLESFRQSSTASLGGGGGGGGIKWTVEKTPSRAEQVPLGRSQSVHPLNLTDCRKLGRSDGAHIALSCIAPRRHGIQGMPEAIC
ncbi:hypothetical protein SprV_0100075800 [Sparganum proliferum]